MEMPLVQTILCIIWTNYLTALGLSSLIYKVGIILLNLTGLAYGISETGSCQHTLAVSSNFQNLLH